MPWGEAPDAPQVSQRVRGPQVSRHHMHPQIEELDQHHHQRSPAVGGLVTEADALLSFYSVGSASGGVEFHMDATRASDILVSTSRKRP